MRKTIPATLLLCCTVLAQDNPTFEERTAARADAIDGSFGMDFTSQYYFRGILQENQGIIGQPWINLGMDLLDESDTGLQTMRFIMGQWNSLHDGPTGVGASNTPAWYESRFYVGFEGQIADRYHPTIRYNVYTSPNGAGIGRPVQELEFGLRFDDTGVFSDSFSLQPTATLAFEVQGQRDGGTSKGVFAGFGIEPSWVIGQLGSSDLTLSVPANLGLSFGDYYERAGGGSDDFFGYLQAGGVLSAPLDFMPARMGPWTGHFGMHLILLGNSNDRRNANDTGEIFFEFGMATTF